jgi:intracellular septation protein
MNGLGYTLRYFAAYLAPMIVFLLVSLASKNIYLATGVGIGLSVLQIGWGLARKAPIGMLQWAGLSLIAVFGAATLLTDDPRFVIFKPTGINLVGGAVMPKRGWMERYVPETIRDLARPMLTVFGYVWSGLMFFTSALNLILVFTVDPTTWAKFNLILPPMSIIGLFLIQNGIVTLAREERERTIKGADFHAAATTSRHVVIAAARSTRCD